MKRIVILFILLACSTARAGYREVAKDATDVSLNVFLRGDDDGKGEAGETSATVTCSYTRNGVPVAVPLIDGTIGAHADGGWVATSSTLVPGEYQFHAPDAAFATGANSVVFTFKASGVIDQRETVALSVWTDARAGYLDELAAANIPADVDAILTDTAAVDTTTEMRTFLTGGDNPVSTLTTAQVNTEADTALSDIKLDHLVAVADADDPVDNSIIAKLVSADYGTADWSDFDWTTDSLEAIRNRGDLAWKTGAGSGATESYTEDTNWTRTVGDNDGGTAADTLTVNGTTFDTGEVAGGTYLEVDVTVDITVGEYGTTVFMWGFYVGGGSHYIRVMAYNYTDSLYEDIGVIGLGTTVQVYEYAMTPDHTDTAAGEIKLKFLHAGGSGVASHVLSIDKMQVNTITEIVNDGSGLTAIPWNPSWDAEVESEVDDSIGGLKTTATLTLADTNELQTNQGNWLTAAGFSTHSAADVWAVVARTLTSGAAPSAAANADAVWDALLTSHTVVGSAGAALSAAGTAGDPWITTLPGAYAPGTAGNIIGNIAETVWTATTRTLTSGSDATAANQTTILANIATAQSDLDIITGASGVVLADDSITAAKIATGAIDADALATNAIDEFWAWVYDGSETVGVGFREIRAVLVGSFSASGTDPRVTLYKRTDKSTTAVSHDHASNGLTRTEN